MRARGDVGAVEFRVRYAETDAMGFVYHTHYLVWCEVGRTSLLRDLGASYADLERDGFFLAVSAAQVRYHAPARYDDLIHVHTRLSQVRSRGVVFDYTVTDVTTQRPLATARTHLVCLDRTGRPQSLPADLRDRLRTALRTGGDGRNSSEAEGC